MLKNFTKLTKKSLISDSKLIKFKKKIHLNINNFGMGNNFGNGNNNDDIFVMFIASYLSYYYQK